MIVDRLLAQIFAVTIMFMIVITVFFYLEQRWFRRLQPGQVTRDPLHGRYFSRYVPDALRAQYPVMTAGVAETGKRSLLWLMMLVLVMLMVLALGWRELSQTLFP